MKRELTLADVVGYTPYNLACRTPEGRIAILRGMKTFSATYTPALGKPVLRPMSDLYREITERDYNNGKPFVPIFELAKIKYPEFTRFSAIGLGANEVFVSSSDSPITGWYEYDNENLSIGEFDLLHRLHFDYRGLIDDGLAINVHDLPANPYEL
jgi:hypothetical protein